MEDNRKASESSLNQNPIETIANLRSKVKVLQQGVRIEREKVSLEAAKSAALEETVQSLSFKLQSSEELLDKKVNAPCVSPRLKMEVLGKVNSEQEKEISRLKINIKKLEENVQNLKTANHNSESSANQGQGVSIIDSQLKGSDQLSTVSSEQGSSEEGPKGVYMTHEERKELKKQLMEEARREIDLLVRELQENLRKTENALHVKSEEVVKVVGDFEMACQSTMSLLSQYRIQEQKEKELQQQISENCTKIVELNTKIIELQRNLKDKDSALLDMGDAYSKLKAKFEEYKQKSIIGTGIIPFFNVKKVGMIYLDSTVSTRQQLPLNLEIILLLLDPTHAVLDSACQFIQQN